MKKREPIKTIKFEQKGRFEAYYSAVKWIKENGYSAGSTCVFSPVAVFKGDCCVEKWRNLSPEEKNDIDGLLDGDFQEGPLTLEIYD